MFIDYIQGEKGSKVTPVYFHYFNAPEGTHDIKNFASYNVDNTSAVKNGVFTVKTPGPYYLQFSGRGEVATGYIMVNGSKKARVRIFIENINKKMKIKTLERNPL